MKNLGVFPGQRLLFKAQLDAQLEIHTGMMVSAILSNKIPCARLCINEEMSSFRHTTHEQSVSRTSPSS